MAWRSHLVDTWRKVSVRNGFERVDGPIFESLDLYKVKSGEGIVNELFHFTDRGGRDLAIRPEFTPTLARMVAAHASALPRPIKWFCAANFCRAERPQRGRLREFWQWNVDILGIDSPVADAECLFVAVDLFQTLGLGPGHVRVKISHRETVRHILAKMGVPEARMQSAFELLDRRDKLGADAFTEAAGELGLDPETVARFDQTCRLKYPAGALDKLRQQLGIDEHLADLAALDEQLRAFGIADWCEYDLGIVRGLAYYTGTVFEIHEISGAERAIAGGGRYDRLIELFGGPSMPAIGFGMGDVVLANVLTDKGLMPEHLGPRPDAFLVATGAAAAHVSTLAARLRRAGLHVRFSYRPGRNEGKLLKEATSSRARYAVILREPPAPDAVLLRSLDNHEEAEVATEDLAKRIAGAGAT